VLRNVGCDVSGSGFLCSVFCYGNVLLFSEVCLSVCDVLLLFVMCSSLRFMLFGCC